MVLHYFDEGIFNSYVIHKAGGGRKSFLEFKLLTFRGLLQRGGVDVIEKSVPKGTHHYPEVVPPSEEKEKTQKEMWRMSPKWY